MLLMFAVFVRCNKTSIAFIIAQYGKILSFDIEVLPYWARMKPISYNISIYRIKYIQFNKIICDVCWAVNFVSATMFAEIHGQTRKHWHETNISHPCFLSCPVITVEW